MAGNCGICKVRMDNPYHPETADCGGDCVKCMAEAGDPGCITTMIRLYSEAIIALVEKLS